MLVRLTFADGRRSQFGGGQLSLVGDKQLLGVTEGSQCMLRFAALSASDEPVEKQQVLLLAAYALVP